MPTIVWDRQKPDWLSALCRIYLDDGWPLYLKISSHGHSRGGFNMKSWEVVDGPPAPRPIFIFVVDSVRLTMKRK